MDRWPAPLNPPAAAPASVRVVPQPPPVEQAVWHYSANGSRRGPVTVVQLKSLVESGVVRANDLLWREGMPAWVEAGTVPELFPAGALVKPPPVPAPMPAAPRPIPAAPAPPESTDEEDDRDDRRSRRDPHTINVHVNQVVERDEDDRPRRRRRGGFRCPYCGCTAPPFVRRQVSGAGWVVFILLLFFTIIFCFIGLFIQEDVYYCRDCGTRV